MKFAALFGFFLVGHFSPTFGQRDVLADIAKRVVPVTVFAAGEVRNQGTGILIESGKVIVFTQLISGTGSLSSVSIVAGNKSASAVRNLGKGMSLLLVLGLGEQLPLLESEAFYPGAEVVIFGFKDDDRFRPRFRQGKFIVCRGRPGCRSVLAGAEEGWGVFSRTGKLLMIVGELDISQGLNARAERNVVVAQFGETILRIFRESGSLSPSRR